MRYINRRSLCLAVLLVALVTSGYGPCSVKKQLSTLEGIEKAEDKLVQAENALNALAKTNRELYRNNVINIGERQLVATIINKANTGLDRVGDRVFAIDPNSPGSVSAGKIDVVALLNTVNAELAKINFGRAELRLAAQAVISLITEAVDLVNRIREVSAAPPKREVIHGNE